MTEAQIRKLIRATSKLHDLVAECGPILKTQSEINAAMGDVNDKCGAADRALLAAFVAMAALTQAKEE